MGDFDSCQSIGGFTGLADHQQHRLGIHQWRAVAELGAIIDLGRYAGDLFEHEFADQTGMPGGAAGD